MYKDKVPEPRASEELIHDLPAVPNGAEKYGFAKATRQTSLEPRPSITAGPYVDEEFGRILHKLDELGLRERLSLFIRRTRRDAR